MKLITIKLLVFALTIFAATCARADSWYEFSVDTSSIAGKSGYMDFQFNPGATSSDGSAVVTNFSSNASNFGIPVITGDAAGALPGTVTINSTYGQWNDYFQSLNFGTTISFLLELSGGSGNTFGLSFYSTDGATPLLTSDSPNNCATTIDLNSASPPTVTDFSSNLVKTSPVPIPAPFWLIGSGLAGLIGLRRIAA